MIFENYYIFNKKQKDISRIIYNPAHPFYYWARYIHTLSLNEIEHVNFLFVLPDDIKILEFYKALSSFLKNPLNRKVLITIGVFELSKIETYLPVYYLDSSIWNFYISIQWDPAFKTYPNFPKKIKILLNNIKNYRRNLYNLIVAREYFELQSRLLGNSYLDLPGGHAAAVTPFIFHSESLMKLRTGTLKENIKNLFKSGRDEDNPAIEWNILFIDDYSDKPLRGGTKTKKEILEQLIKPIEDATNFKFNIEIASSINDAIIKIKNEKKDDVKDKKQYDIILLDYLLGDKEGNNNGREYGDEFLRKLKSEKELLKQRGPLGKFWIFPVSSFSNAMLSKLEEEGIGRIDDNWYILEDADMINSPELFTYNLLQLIYLQLIRAIVTKEDIIQFVLNNMIGVYDENNFTRDFRLNAKRLYGVFMHRFGVKEALKQDMANGSAFAASILKFLDKDKEAFEAQRFYEYTRKLIYLIGYATHQETPQMYHLLNYIVSAIPNNNSGKPRAENEIENIKSFLSNVQKYIDALIY